MVLVALTLTLLAVVLQSAHSRAQPTVAAPATNIARPEVASPDQAAAQGGATERDGGAAANELSVEPPKPPSADPAVLALERLVTDITAFVGGELDVSREPQSLFDVPFSDDAAIAVAAKRLRVLIAAEQTEVTELEGAVTDAGIAAPGDGRDGGVGEDAVDGSEEVEQLDEALWNAQLDVDRARLRFYQMPADERAAIIDKHVARQRDASEREQNAAEARRKAKEAEDALKTAEEAAQKADTAVDQRIKDEVVRIKKPVERSTQINQSYCSVTLYIVRVVQVQLVASMALYIFMMVVIAFNGVTEDTFLAVEIGGDMLLRISGQCYYIILFLQMIEMI